MKMSNFQFEFQPIHRMENGFTFWNKNATCTIMRDFRFCKQESFRKSNKNHSHSGNNAQGWIISQKFQKLNPSGLSCIFKIKVTVEALTGICYQMQPVYLAANCSLSGS